MSIGQLGKQLFTSAMGVKLSDEELGEMGKRVFQQVMGVGPKKTLSERATEITGKFEKWESEGLTLNQISRLQKLILKFSEQAFALHYDLNRAKLAREELAARGGDARQSFEMFRSQSRQYVVIRDWNDQAKKFIDQMNENLTGDVEASIDALTPDSIRDEDSIESCREALAIFGVFNDRLMRSISRQFDDILVRCGGDECSNYLLFCHTELDARWQDAIHGHREVDQRLNELLDERVDELTR